MNKRLIIFLLSVFICSTVVYSQTGNQLTDKQKTWLTKANRHGKNGWIYLRIEGTPAERGFKHGYLPANEIKESLRVICEVWHYQTAVIYGALGQYVRNSI